MTLLQKIQDAAIDSKSDLPSLLRNCKVLATRLKSEEFKAWVDSELNGYDSIEDLPDYRVLHVNSKGHFTGYGGSQLKNASIPLTSFPEQFRDVLSKAKIMQSVASLQNTVDSFEGSDPQEQWPPDFVARFGGDIYQDMHCLEAFKIIPIAHVVGILDKIKTRILNFVLEIEEEIPGDGNTEATASTVPQEKVHQIFNTHIHGPVQNMATGSSHTEQTSINNAVDHELFEKLLEAIKPIENAVLQREVETTIEDMRKTQGTPSFLDHYQSFMSTLADHAQVLGPMITPYLPTLAALIPK